MRNDDPTSRPGSLRAGWLWWLIPMLATLALLWWLAQPTSEERPMPLEYDLPTDGP